MTQPRLCVPLAFGLLLLAPVIGCDDGETESPRPWEESRTGFRNSDDITLERTPDASAPSGPTDIWDLEGPKTLTKDGVLVLAIANWKIFDAAGNATCDIFIDGTTTKLRDIATGQVVLTASAVFLIRGDFTATPGVLEDWEVADYTFRQAQVLAGGWWDTDKAILDANAEIQGTFEERQLLIGALVEGLCGAPSL